MHRVQAHYFFSCEKEAVFLVYRDEAPRLFNKLPNMKAARVLQRKEEGSKVNFVVHCQGEAPIPAPLKPFVSPEMLTWTYSVIFDAKTKRATWDIDAPYFKKNFQADGTFLFQDAPGGSKVSFQAQLLSRFPLVGGLMEKIVAYYLTKNLAIFAREAHKLLEQRSS